MPSGHSGGSSGGHFGGGSFSHSGGHFSSSRPTFNGGHFGGAGRIGGFTPRPHRPFYQPRVVVFGGHSVYLGAGRASTVSVLGFLIVIALVVTAIFGFSWMSCESDLEEIKSNHSTYLAIAREAATKGDTWQVDGTVGGYNSYGKHLSYEEYEDSGKFCIFYSFDAHVGKVENGFSFYVYTYDEVVEMIDNGVRLALEGPWANSTDQTDSVPLNYKDKALQDDAEYLDRMETRKTVSMGTSIAAGIVVALVIANVLTRATAKKATAEQIAADKAATATNADNKTAPAGTWRCEYCGALNDNNKERCDGCGAKRQK